MQFDQHVGGERVERRLIAAGGQRAGVGLVAQILQQQQTRGYVGGEDFRRAETEPVQQPRDPQEGGDILLRRRRVHQHRAVAAAAQSDIAPERRIAGERMAFRIPPAIRGKETVDGRGSVSHRYPSANQRAASPAGRTRTGPRQA